MPPNSHEVNIFDTNPQAIALLEGAFSPTQMPVEALRREAEFAFVAPAREVLYVKGSRIEVSAGRVKTLDPDSLERDWKAELVEIVTVINAKRWALAKTLVAEHPHLRKSCWYPENENKILGAGYATHFCYEVLKNNLPSSIPDIEGKKDEIIREQKFIDDLIELRNAKPALFRLACHERARKLQRALLVLAAEPELHANLHIGFSNRIGGVDGRAMLLADGLMHALPNITIHTTDILGANFAAGERAQLVKNSVPPPTAIPVLQLASWNKRTFGLKASGVVNDFFPMKACFETHTIAPDYLRQPVTNDLCNPFGTLMLNADLVDRKEQRDAWPLAKLISERSAWRRENLSLRANATLWSLSRAEGWQPDKAIWALAYFQKIGKFQEEMAQLANYLLQEEASLPFIEEGKQVIIHCRPGVMVREDLVETLTDLKFRVIDKDGVLHEDPNTSLPVTVILHENIPNQ
ncbi:hypothetical protein OAO01_04935, partial [Oligoflexia bacterium]|nr:hypothetical protein [Oligoflexia bacterium]